ncbi:MAG: LysM peptidoglycan-binding domain-containing protein, partial [Gammaproteobacteria bacterium]|nr:LysM peptidoglycan-binding domain-containing protein [Gammaproteobacteria bacterium]
QAYDTCSALVAQLQAAKSTYTVVRGDSLWRIAGKSDVYGNALEWPLIFKANSDSIKHADLIYPKQNLNVVSNPLKTDVDSATWYAQHRGAWKNHRADKRDQEWLNGTLTPPAPAASPASAAMPMPSPAPAATSAPAATTH